MKTAYEPETGRLTIRFADREAVESFLVGVETNAGFLVQLATPLRLHDAVTVVVATDEELGRFEARVAQVFDKGFGSFGTAFLVDDPQSPRRALGADAAPSPTTAEPNTATEVDPDPLASPSSAEPIDDEAPEPVDEGAAGEMMGTSPIHRINAMNPRQRAMLASRAGRTERQILLRDKSPLVLESLLNNPQIDSEDVLRIARSSRVVAPTLQRIAGDARWSNNPEILAVIARHPKTPSVLATRLLPSLRTSDLRTMAKMSSGLREMVRKAALREYMQRTGQRI